MIRLAIISDDPGRGGAYKVAADIAEGLDKNLYRIQLFFLCGSEPGAPPGTYLDAPPISIDYSLRSYLRLAFIPKDHEKNYQPLNTSLEHFEPDIIHFHTHATLLSVIRGIKKLRSTPKFIFTDHSQRVRPGEYSSLNQFLISRAYRRLFRSTRVVFVSDYAYQTALKLGYGLKKKDVLITNSIDSRKFSYGRRHNDTAQIKVVYLSRIHHAKGHHLLLDSWGQLPYKRGVSLHLYGYEEDGGEIRKRIELATFPNPIYYEGPTQTPETILQTVQIGVFPSFREGLPLALLEMMACGLPVVASDIPEIKSIMTHGHDGLLFRCGDSKDLCRKVNLLINDRSLRQQIGQQAHGTAQKYSNPIASAYHQLYLKVIEQV